MIHIYNTLTKQKELLKPIKPSQLGIYVCGLTVYDDCHIGHGRLLLWFDVLIRYLRSVGYQVTYVRNITDIDDKIIKRAQELNICYQELTDKVIASVHQDEGLLNIIPPNFEPRVTEHIPEIIAMISTLINKGFAYITKKGDVYYQISKFPQYGKLANQTINNLYSGIRIEINDEKKNPLDFVLWKATESGEPFWSSPWSNGRPGWHIECSAMAKKYLGKHFDIHGGGIDLQFPHHQNELAQSEAANGTTFVNYWMHIGFVQYNQEKMSKSIGNFFTLKDILSKTAPEVFRYFILTSHYRSPINFSQKNLNNAEIALQRLYIILRDVGCDDNVLEIDSTNQFYKDFHLAMNDDFNTPEALSVLFNLVREINQLCSIKQLSKAKKLTTLLKYLGTTLGLFQNDPKTFLEFGIDIVVIENLISSRNIARINKDWILADRIRDKLSAMGIILEDTINDTKWSLEDRCKYLNYLKSNDV
ncbi:MAG: cysteine--tRNA ligase [Coxiellaceae bacterium]|jgi:cysteinyl-tRNA synthetase|nr:cysteine--tRNA ligase [Coxiellaceae bacterium]